MSIETTETADVRRRAAALLLGIAPRTNDPDLVRDVVAALATDSDGPAVVAAALRDLLRVVRDQHAELRDLRATTTDPDTDTDQE